MLGMKEMKPKKPGAERPFCYHFLVPGQDAYLAGLVLEGRARGG